MSPVHAQAIGPVLWITTDHPPVNAASRTVRAGLARLPVDVPGATINRLCGSAMDAVGTAARAIRSG